MGHEMKWSRIAVATLACLMLGAPRAHGITDDPTGIVAFAVAGEPADAGRAQAEQRLKTTLADQTRRLGLAKTLVIGVRRQGLKARR